ncbi:hypothetical protein QJS04_geneDACA005912 [Acorus gramineus]|uniref:Uncharacterized protein n=1 Tax=Acorus gramineus TaxID=55184 RepID=A0AAV9B7N0_ACOGR|nr:hypothetical protein QJS04_geneDACA005912 [Acorus gramineus]
MVEGTVSAGGGDDRGTTRRMSNPRFLESNQFIIDIPPTPPSKQPFSFSSISLIDPFSSSSSLPSPVTTALIISSWYLSNIEVLLLNNYLLTIYGYRYLIFLTTLHMLFCSAYSSAAIRFPALIPLQQIVSRCQLLKIAALFAIFNVSIGWVPLSKKKRKEILKLLGWVEYLNE